MTKENLQEASKKLAQDFEKIIENHPEADKADISNALMARMRLETIYLLKEVVEGYNSSGKVTIDPLKVVLKSAWEKLSDAEKDNYYKICAYSFGPFNPAEYFKSEFKILWLLKEPLMKPGDLDKYASGEYSYLGGFNQAADFGTWEKIEAEEGKTGTKHKLVEYTKTLLEKIIGRAMGYDEVLNHICILEVNHFPGLAFNGNESDDKYSLPKWHELNDELIQELVNFYDPKILIGGRTLEYYLTHGKYEDPKYIEDIAPAINNGLEIMQDKIGKWSYNDSSIGTPTPRPEADGKNFGRNGRYYGEGGKRIYIQAYHPSNSRLFKVEFAEKDADVINEWIEEASQETEAIGFPKG